MNHRHHDLQVLLDHWHRFRRGALQVADHAGDVLARRFEESPVLGFLQLADEFGVQVVETHGRQRVEYRTEYRQAGSAGQGQSIRRDRRKRRLAAGLYLTAFQAKIWSLAPADQRAFLGLHLVAATRQGAHVEGVVARLSVAQPELQADAEMSGMAAGTPPHLGQPAALVERVVERARQRVADQMQGVEKVAFAGAVRADQIGQRPQARVAGGDALVVAQHHAGQEDRGGHDMVPH